MQLAMGDCLAIALLEHKGFTAHDFKVFHPGGSLGASLKFVADLMHTGDALPLVGEETPMSEGTWKAPPVPTSSGPVPTPRQRPNPNPRPRTRRP